MRSRSELQGRARREPPIKPVSDGASKRLRRAAPGPTPREARGEPESGLLQIWVSDPNVNLEAQGIDGFYRTREGAVLGVQRRFGDPYKVAWSIEARAGDAVVLRGEFDEVKGYCPQHVAEWFILPIIVEP
jgi:hypothetical protein